MTSCQGELVVSEQVLGIPWSMQIGLIEQASSDLHRSMVALWKSRRSKIETEICAPGLITGIFFFEKTIVYQNSQIRKTEKPNPVYCKITMVKSLQIFAGNDNI